MRSDNDVLHGEQILLHSGLEIEYVEGSAGDRPSPWRAHQCAFINDWTSSGVDEDRRRAHAAQRSLVDQVMSLMRERTVDTDDIGEAKQCAQVVPSAGEHSERPEFRSQASRLTTDSARPDDN